MCAGSPELFGELPVACLAEEIDTPGEDQVRALLTIAGNPVVSTPNAGRLRRALEEIELMVSVDIYVNETTRHADVILPAPSSLCRSHYDLGLYQLAIRSVANYSPPVIEPDPAVLPEWQTLLRLAGIAGGQGPGRRRRGVRRLRGAEHGRAGAEEPNLSPRRNGPPTRSWLRSSRGAARSAHST